VVIAGGVLIIASVVFYLGNMLTLP
jgi:hypothetical protein